MPHVQLTILAIVLGASAFSSGCSDGGSAHDPADTASADTASADTASADTVSVDSVAADTAAADTVSADTAGAGSFSCGALLMCDGSQSCGSRGQGACIGPAPDANGNCGPNCAAYECGGAPTCLCASFWCDDLPTDCNDCSCAPKPDASCSCDDADGHVSFSCAGA